MDSNSRRQMGRNRAFSLLNASIEALDLAKEVSAIVPAKTIFGSVSTLLTIIKDSMVKEQGYVELGLGCANICRALERGMNGKRLDDLNQSVCDAIRQLTITVAEIQRKVTKRSGRNVVSRLLRVKSDREAIAAWNSDLNRVLQVFTAELVVNTHTMVSDLHHNATTAHKNADGQHCSTQERTPLGELPPSPPRACFGRDKLVEKIVGLAHDLIPIALTGAGGIGKTSIALTVLHHNRIKERFGEDRRFIRCDQFPASRAHLLNRLSEVIGAGVENPEDLAPLRPLLSSREMILVLDNVESILDPRGTNAQEIYATVVELSELSNICLCLTSRISMIPPTCKHLGIPVLSIEAARATFYCIYKNNELPDLVDKILEQLDFHPLSVTLLATVAHQNKWDNNRLTREWEQQRTGVLQTQHSMSLAATIELSLASPMFQELGPDARELLGVVAFFPQGINESNIDWLFPTRARGNPSTQSPPPTTGKRDIFEKFCDLSLTHRSNGFITMLAPLRDHLCPKDPASSPLLCTVKQHYFRRLWVDVDPGQPGFEEAQWITSEDVNIEHLLDVFTTVDPNLAGVWDACAYFMQHLHWHKKRLVILEPKFRSLPDDHPSKPDCLFQLSLLFHSVGNFTEYKRLLDYVLKFRRKEGNDLMVAETLRFISDASEILGLHEEGMQQAEEALGIYKRLENTMGQARLRLRFARLLYRDDQLDAAEESASQAIGLLSDKRGDQFEVCRCYRILGKIHHSKGKVETAFTHFEQAIVIASTFNWDIQLFWNNYELAKLLFTEKRFDDAHAHLGRAKSYAVSNQLYLLGRAMQLQAELWYDQGILTGAKSEALDAIDTYEKVGAVKDVDSSRTLLRKIEAAMDVGGH